MPRPIDLTIPTPDVVQLLLQLSATHHFSDSEIEHFLRTLHETYPHSRLLVSTPVILIHTNAHTGIRQWSHGHIAIIERLDQDDDTLRYLLQLHGGPTGHESFYIKDFEQFAKSSRAGWSACGGTPNRWNACYVPPESMDTVYQTFSHAYLQGPQAHYPTPLTDAERADRLQQARQGFLTSLRQSSARSESTEPHLHT